MSYARFDDGFYVKPEVLATDLEALGLFALARVYSSHHQTDGFLPDVALAMLARGAERGAHLAQQLVAHNLWVRDGSGYRDRSYLTDNPSAREVEKSKKAAKLRMRSFRSRSSERKESVTRNKRRTNAFVPERSGEEWSNASSSSFGGSGESEGRGGPPPPADDAATLIAEINRVGGKAFSAKAKANVSLARARLAEYPLAHLLAMVRWRWKTWDESMRAQYFRPETLLNATKCESYLGGMPAREREGPAKPLEIQVVPIAARMNALSQGGGRHG